MTMPTFVDGTVVHQTDLNALATGINNVNSLLTGANAPRAYVPTCWIYMNTSHSIANNVDTLLTFDATGLNNDNMWVPSVQQITVQTAGNYVATAQVHFDANSVGIRAAHILFNGTALANSLAVSNMSAAGAIGEGTVMNFTSVAAQCSAGATFYLSVYQNSGGALNVNNTNSGTYMQAIRIGD